MIRLLKQKAIYKKGLAEERRIGLNEIHIFNQMRSRGEIDMLAHNKNIYKPYINSYMR
jgi:hypothetical protein